jgi:2-phosphosulfolactate phosphatase
MRIDCQLIPGVVPGPKAGCVYVVIDVLRATSTIVTAFMNGCESVIPVAEVEEAFRLVNGPLADALLGGEREGFAIEGFDLGNSPEEYTSQRVGGRTIVITTTNGSRAFESIPVGEVGVVASFLNLGAVARHCLRYRKDILFIPSGRKGGFSLEDTVCAGGIMETVRRQQKDGIHMTDAALASEVLFGHFRANLVEMLRSSIHGRYLEEIGLESDLEYCAQVDVTLVTPIYQNGRIVLFPDHR